ncbi:MAG TPA: DUF1232 domain-containing protein [Verrucomicrobiae bacterium]|jgi:uncharacterized membrane protein YkvA (DUF1232 family)|nr:DUF1232 domain-containing protein [Verrucomicrobiae bacterium]
MGEISSFVNRGASMITPRALKGIHKKMPFLKLKFTEVDAPSFPHLVDQLEFLAAVVEDFAEGADDDLPYHTVAAAAFALIYAHRVVDLIPDTIPDFGHADDSAVVRAVLIEHQKTLVAYAGRHEMKWEAISVQP